MNPKTKLGYFDLSMIVVSLVIGMGIFRTPVNVAQAAIEPSVYFAAWIFGGIMALCGALTFAEIGSRLPVNGGYFRIFSKCYHPSFAFMLNGTILVSNAASVAGVALIGSEYISGVIFRDNPAANTESVHLAIACGEILLFLGLNLLGLKISATTQNVLVVFKLVVILILISAIFVPVENAPVTVAAASSHSWTDYLQSFGVCLITISFTYGGYQQTINFGGEINNAKKIMPKAIITGILIVLVLYIAINYAYMEVIGFNNLKTADSIASIMATRVLGNLGSTILTLMLFFSVLAYVNVGLMANPRVICAMSEDGTMPAFFSRYSKRGVPVTALLTFTIMSIAILFFAKTFDELVKYVIFIDSIGFIAAAATIFILRKKQGSELNDSYTIKLFPFVPLLFILAYTFVATSVVIDKPDAALYGLIIFACFLPLYFLFVWMARSQKKQSGN
ncbi:MAG: amino acid permease [Bacteroidota bacterium]|nr:amino acid permease [Bacteroidota bacterium]